jgi:hypothetical protein
MNMNDNTPEQDAPMAREERQLLRDRIQDEMLKNLLQMVKGGSADPKELKLCYDLKLAEQDCENAAKRNEIAERKLAGVDEKREFTIEEMTTGIRAMLGKGDAE